ncbi:MAG TPA: NUDIX hydrolase [Firmicutes bacterium]|nr:NUDIX hydrolase [Bacillota bacterium]HOQ24180.1 NUDIX hydrolase [Bacillota bacterium]HPT67591.1 NUDIX hydrolase [Bacillota bacterium]
MKAWEILSSRTVYRLGSTEMREEVCRHPAKGLQAPFFRLFLLDWVNVVPLTPEGEVLLVRQFRKGIHDFTLELPGGTMDPGEDEPAAAGLRELTEETGYRTDKLILLGWVHPNPAVQNNKCHFFLAEDVYQVQEQKLDKWEEIELVKIPWDQIPEKIANGEITHSLGVLGLMRARQYKEKRVK